MRRSRSRATFQRPAAFALAVAAVLSQPVSAMEEARPASDPRSVEIARAVLVALGGEQAWSETRYVRWRFFGRRLHYWDRHSGDIRIESPAGEDRAGNEQPGFVVLMNIDTKQGHAWENGEEVQDPAKLAEYLDRGHQIWVNDSYWMFMPYKLLDPGVHLTYAGERPLADGRAADVLEMTFDDGVGYTPTNRYEVFVSRDTGLLEQWSFYAEATDAEPQFTLPWSGWQRFGKIWLATDHGQKADWEIAVYDALPASVFHAPDPVE